MRNMGISISRVYIFAAAFFLIATISSAQRIRTSFGDEVLVPVFITMRAASGALTTGETTTAIVSASRIDLVVFLSITTLTLPDADDEVDFYFQTSYDNKSTWTDLENVHFTMADNGTTATKVLRLGPWPPLSSADKAADNTDGALADDTKNAYPVGGQIRIKTSVTGATAPTYAYSATVFLR